MVHQDQSTNELVNEIAVRARRRRLSIGSVESLTVGRISAALGAGAEASQWFKGAVVAYAREVKFDLLNVPVGPVVSAECASTMATSGAVMLHADITVAVTGVGGPDPDEGYSPGTVFMAIADGDTVSTRELHFDGEPDEVLEQTVSSALTAILERLSTD